MKKHLSKKLILSKETVTNLNDVELNQIKAGATVTRTCPEYGCTTNELMCTTGCWSATCP
ncbi:MAG TPA: class I lanthipeptide [Candidatus Deferrimicrobium sp.]|nr:class I lanthipeptide [Candidatus Deferrimicrobium sp.]